MGAFATVTLPVDLTRCHDAAGVAHSVADRYPGTRGATVDSAASTLTFDLHFPGNLSGLVTTLGHNLIPVGESASVSVPIESLLPDVAGGADAIAARVTEGSEVWDVAFARGHWVTGAALSDGRLVATIVPGSNGMHQIYDGLLALALVVNDVELAAAQGRSTAR